MVDVSAPDLRYGGPLARRGRVSPRRRGFATVILVPGLLFAAGAALGAQPLESYQFLSNPARATIDRLPGVGDEDGQSDDSAVYNALEESDRTTFEAIMHALEAQGLLNLVTGVTAIWGEIPRSTQGMDQFRLSVTFAAGAPERFRRSEYGGSGNPHVKLSNGNRVGWRDAATARQSGGHPSMQVSWLKRNPTVGEIDIDYVPFGALDFFGFGHSSPQNSDVRADPLGEPSNYDRHVRRYGHLERWWVTR